MRLSAMLLTFSLFANTAAAQTAPSEAEPASETSDKALAPQADTDAPKAEAAPDPTPEPGDAEAETAAEPEVADPEPNEADPETPATEPTDAKPASPEAETAADSEEAAGADERAAPEANLEGAAATTPEPAPTETSSPPPMPSVEVAHGATDGAAVPERVRTGPNKALLSVGGALAAGAAVTYGLAVVSHNELFKSEPRRYEDLESLRTRTNTFTAVSGGLALGAVGAGVTAFIVGEF